MLGSPATACLNGGKSSSTVARVVGQPDLASFVGDNLIWPVLLGTT